MTRFYEASDEAGLPRNPASLPELLQEAGYRTIGLVTNGHLARTANFDQGFEHYSEMFSGDGKPYAPADRVTQAAFEQLDRVGDDPFFLYLHYMDVHYPYLPPREFAKRFDFARVAGKRDGDIQETWLKEIELDSPQNENIEEHARGLYDSEILFCDHWIGELLDWLEARGLDDNTMVIITADHGEEFLEHGNTIHKAKMYEELVHVPLAIRIPGVSPKRIEEVVRTFDVMPTILDYCGVSLDALELDARSLRSLIEGGTQEEPRIAFASFPARSSREAPSHRQMIRVGRHKILLDLNSPTQSELYDLHDDPGELRNRFEELDDARASLLRRLESVIAPLQQETLDNLARTAATTNEAELERKRLQSERVKEALENMSPEDRDAAIMKALEARAEASTAPATDLEVIEQLESLGYID